MLKGIQNFITNHGLNINIRGYKSRYYATIQNGEVKEGMMLNKICGYGSTPNEAIISYFKEVSGCLVVINAYGDNRKEIQFPIIIPS